MILSRRPKEQPQNFSPVRPLVRTFIFCSHFGQIFCSMLFCVRPKATGRTPAALAARSIVTVQLDTPVSVVR